MNTTQKNQVQDLHLHFHLCQSKAMPPIDAIINLAEDLDIRPEILFSSA